MDSYRFVPVLIEYGAFRGPDTIAAWPVTIRDIWARIHENTVN